MRRTDIGCLVPALALAALLAPPLAPAAMAEAEPAGPTFTLHGFSDVTLSTSRWRPDGGGESRDGAFALGQYDLYVVSHLSDRFSFLGESVFESEPGGATVVDLERAFLRFSWSDAFRVSAGRTHTPLGWWNTAFHHGRLLQPTVERPIAVRFEDDGGLLPLHAVGLEFSGGVPVGGWELEYIGNIANGRGPIADAVQTGQDLNLHKATALQLALTRSGDVEASVGASGYADLIPPDPEASLPTGETRERIGGAHAHVRTRVAELFAEGYQVDHSSDAGSFRQRTGYVVLVAGNALWRPYGLYDRLDAEAGDPFYGPSLEDRTEVGAGVRLDVTPLVAIKLEYRNFHTEGGDGDGFFAQTAFSF